MVDPPPFTCIGAVAAAVGGVTCRVAQKKVNLISIRDGIDLHTAAGRLMAMC
jgi:hypothetical protein